MYTPISNAFFDQLIVAIERAIPSTIVYFENEEKKTIKGLVKTLEVIEGKEFMVLKSKEKIALNKIIIFNGRRHIQE
ncbi:MAG: transcriptional antiterminator Rof [Candidatus Marinarcus sp.]|uniref:transcriptional antiterminator Rof n=1 Tax=Candidatus Marinarcus sp. TaxID=3100987 RepID=UPI003B00BAEE